MDGPYAKIANVRESCSVTFLEFFTDRKVLSRSLPYSFQRYRIFFFPRKSLCLLTYSFLKDTVCFIPQTPKGDGWDGSDGKQKCPLIFLILRYMKHYTHIYLNIIWSSWGVAPTIFKIALLRWLFSQKASNLPAQEGIFETKFQGWFFFLENLKGFLS